MYHRHMCVMEDVWFHPTSDTFWERTRALLALSATCQVMRQMFLMEAWEVYVVCIPEGGLDPRWAAMFESRSEFRYRVLLGKPRLAANVRYSPPFVYLECPRADTGSDRHLKDSGGKPRVHFRQTGKTLSQMPYRLTKPPHPRNWLGVGGVGSQVLRDNPEETEKEATAPPGPDARLAPHNPFAVAVLPQC